MVFLLENVPLVRETRSTRGKGGRAVQLEKTFEAITRKTTTKRPASSVIPADVPVNPMADPPKARRKVYVCHAALASVSTNILLLHYRVAIQRLARNFSCHQVPSRV